MSWMGVVGQVIFWRYSRGSWQYDILCGVILAFIFLTPADVFDGSVFSQAKEPKKMEERDRDSDRKQARTPLETHSPVSLKRERERVSSLGSVRK